MEYRYIYSAAGRRFNAINKALRAAGKDGTVYRISDGYIWSVDVHRFIQNLSVHINN